MKHQPLHTNLPRYCAHLALIACFLLAFVAAGAQGLSRDRQPPTRPTNLRVTGKTAFSASLAWNPSIDNSQHLNYVVVCSNGRSTTVPQSSTSVTFTDSLESRGTYSFHVYAVDAAGNRSTNSNAVTVTLPRDTIAPTQPIVTVTEVGPTHVRLSWSSTDDGPFIFYFVSMNGQPVLYGGQQTSGTIYILKPQTSYTFTVQARDNGINWSPVSAPVGATTLPSDPTDQQPPTKPGNLRTNGMEFGEEIWLQWDQSFDNVTPFEFIYYEVFVNGVLDHRTVEERTIVYVTAGILNTIEVFAVDAAGNRSAAAVKQIDLRGP